MEAIANIANVASTRMSLIVAIYAAGVVTRTVYHEELSLKINYYNA